MDLAAHVAALVAVMTTGVVYGTDVFCALVQRPALARVDDAVLTSVMGNVHRVADQRMRIPGMLGIVGAAAACVFAAVAGHGLASAAAGAAVALLVVWLLVYVRISAPINRTFTAGAGQGSTPSNARALQDAWDRVITPRAILQGLAVMAMCVNLLN
jgi:hypothetical protein